ncbi:MAG: hypothetical protein IPI60_16355 [Saprospiraceae bacterium]|jgi:hypothetical protein|nr:hypothetical protein [Saprospiraceae bacterium]
MSPETIAVSIPLAFFLMIFAIRYLVNREKLAMIEKGIITDYSQRKRKISVIRWGYLMIGIGLGLLSSFIITKLAGLAEDEAPAIYFSMIFILGGIGLVMAHKVEKKETREEELL